MELRRLLKHFKKGVVAAFVCLFVSGFISASESAVSAFVEACKAYSRGDWSDAKFMLRKSVSYKENLNPDTYYMLISAEVYDGDNKNALDDCNFFLENFPDSMYYSRVYYQKGKIITKKPILPTKEEMENNSRSKSAKLRIFEKI